MMYISKRCVIINTKLFSVLCLILIIFFVGSCKSTDQGFASKLHLTIQDASNNNSTFAMIDITNFTWDGLFIFSPYTPPEKIESALGYPWPPAKVSGIEHDDGACLIMFTFKDQVVEYYMYLRKDGDFALIGSPNKIVPERAIFSAYRNTDNLVVIQPQSD